MRTLIKKLLPVFLPLFIFILPQVSVAQEENDEYLIDSLDYKEDLLDSNDVYMSMYNDTLAEEGKWVAIKKSEFIKSVGGEEANDLDYNYYNDNEILYLWRPNVSIVQVNWSPYTNGYWLYTTAGWVWISYYSWGWAPYNYGRWWWSGYYGWVWLPGSYWAPNWCIWRHHHHYVGWYPVHPRIRWRGYHKRWHRNHVVISHPKHWTFVEKKKFTDPIYDDTRLKDLEIAKNSSRLVDNVSKETGVKYNGPNVKTITQETGKRIDPVLIDPKTKQIKEDVKYKETTRTNETNKKYNTGETNTQSDDRYKDTKTKSETPNKDSPTKETPKVETPGNETPKTEKPKYETPKTETPKKETPKYETPKTETPKKETPKYDPPKQETPKQQPKYEAPRNDTPKQSPNNGHSREKSSNSGKSNNSGKSGNSGKTGKR
jgi:hypothetical protein